MEHSPFITVIGASSCSGDEEKLAEEVGRELARRGATLICGGLEGVMQAACRGAHSEGGLTVGILPGNRRQDANPYVSIPIVTGMDFGHTDPMLVLPYGCVCEINCEQQKIIIPESAVLD